MNTMVMRGIMVIMTMIKKFARGDIEGAVPNWAPNIEWIECKSFPFVKNDGIYTGIQAVIDGVQAQIPVYYDNFSIEMDDFVDGGDKIVMVGFYTVVWKATGKKFKANTTHTCT